jgi:ABC-type transport system involved in multi-copper enzyme maturation permease subunit
MFVKVFGFELRYQLKSRLFLFGTTIFLLLTFLAVFSPNVQLSGIGGANVNSPTAIVQTHWIMALLAVLIGAAFTNDAALRDGEFRMREIIYSTRITKSAYLLGRFFGAFIVAYLVYLGTTVGFMLGTLMPTLDPELLGAFDLGHYVYAATAVGLPSLFTNLTIVYAVAVWSRDQRIAYAVIVALLVSYQIASGWLGQLDYRTLAALVDPSGSSAMIEATQYWTVFEHNTQLIPFEGLLLYNRLLWFGISIALLAITVARFSFSLSTKKKSNKGVADLEEQPGRVAIPGVFSLSRAAFDSGTAWKQFLARTRFEIRGVLKSVFFWVLVALAGALSLGNFFGSGAFFGTEVYPVTRVLISIMSGSVTLSLLIILVFYGAELVWRDREVRFQEILGSSPAPNWTFVLSKMVAAVLVVFIFLLATALVAIIWQVMHGCFAILPCCRTVRGPADSGSQQVLGHAVHGAVHRCAADTARRRVRGSVVPVWRHQRHPVLGHEWLRRGAGLRELVHVLLGQFRNDPGRHGLSDVEPGSAREIHAATEKRRYESYVSDQTCWHYCNSRFRRIV